MIGTEKTFWAVVAALFASLCPIGAKVCYYSCSPGQGCAISERDQSDCTSYRMGGVSIPDDKTSVTKGAFKWTNRNDCLDDPAKKDYWSDTVLGCIRGNNEFSGTVSSLAACQKRCVDETSYTCLSIDYKPSSKRCHLSKLNRDTLTNTSDFTQPCHLADWSYAERVDVGEWTPAVSACIHNNDIRTRVAVPDLASCRLICSQNDGCCSVDYRNQRCNLNGKNKRTVTPASDYTEPCYHHSEYQYAERTDKLCGY